jgi:hypothetical protein
MSASPSRPRAVRTLKRQPPPPGIYASSYTDELAMEICGRLASGESLRAICRDDPAMPTEMTVWNWARANPEFEALKAWAQAQGRARSLAAQRARDAARAAAKAAARAARGGWTTTPSGYDEAVMDAICLRLMMGESLTHICRDPDMPCIGTVYNWLRARPELVDDYRRVRAIQQDTYSDRVRELAPLIGRGSMRSVRAMWRALDRAAARVKLRRYADG